MTDGDGPGEAAAGVPALAPLTLSAPNALLSPEACAAFDPDAFLLSRRQAAIGAHPSTSAGAPGGESSDSPAHDASAHLPQQLVRQDLRAILAELRAHASALDAELKDVINADYRAFVGLAGEVRAEAHRIERLQWRRAQAQAPPLPTQGSAEDAPASAANSKAQGKARADDALGTAGVSAAVVSARAALAASEGALRSLLLERADAAARGAQLADLLRLDEQTGALEARLGLGLESKAGTGSQDGAAGAEPALGQAAQDVVSRSAARALEDELYADEPESADGADINAELPVAPAANGAAAQQVPPTEAEVHADADAQPDAEEHVPSPAALAEALRQYGAVQAQLAGVRRGSSGSGEGSGSAPGTDTAASTDAPPVQPPAKLLSAHAQRLRRVEARMAERAERLLGALLSREEGSLLLRAERASTGDGQVNGHGHGHAGGSKGAEEHADGAHDAWRDTALGRCASVLDGELSDPAPSSGPANAPASARRRARDEQARWLGLCVDVLSAAAGSEQGVSRAEALVRERLVRLTLDEVITPDALAEKGGPSPTEAIARLGLPPADAEAPLGKFYARLLLRIADDLLPLAHAASGSPLAVFAGVIYPDTLERLSSSPLGAQIFFAGRPEAFHASYRTSHAFLRALQALAPSEREADAARAHPQHEAFEKRWQLPVYFQMRQRQLVGQLEAELAHGSDLLDADADADAHSDAEPLMRGTAATLEAFATPWRADIHLDDLLLREWRLSLQVCSRCKTWLDDVLPEEAEAPKQAPQQQQPAQAALRGHARTASGTPGEASPAVADAGKQAELLSRSAIVAAELLLLERELLRLYDELVAPKLRVHSDSDEAAAAIAAQLRAKLQQALPFAQSLVPALVRSIKRLLSAQCAEPIRLIRQVSTQYRGAPSGHSRSSSMSQVEPSFFVAQITAPLRKLFVSAPAQDSADDAARLDAVTTTAALRLGPDIKRDIVLATVEEIVDKYAAALFTMNQTHESLRRLKRSNQALGFASSIFGSGSGGSGANEAEATRMKIQMQADVNALKADIAEIAAAAGVHLEPDEVDGWKRLLAAAAGATENVA